jgi:insertion element IS1 protein InsB
VADHVKRVQARWFVCLPDAEAAIAEYEGRGQGRRSLVANSASNLVGAASSFVQKKANKQWIWIAMDTTTRQVTAFHVGDRSRTSAKCLWAKMPEACRQPVTFYTDQYMVYAGVIPAAQHRAISTLARKTNHIERFNNTLRQHVSRLVCEALSFSKKLANHIGAIKLFICHYNLTRAAA